MVTACVIERARENRLRLSSARSHMHAQMCMDDEIYHDNEKDDRMGFDLTRRTRDTKMKMKWIYVIISTIFIVGTQYTSLHDSLLSSVSKDKSKIFIYIANILASIRVYDCRCKI